MGPTIHARRKDSKLAIRRRIAIRVDASSQIGTGHYMRCLSLADALQEFGAQIRFVSRHMPGHLRKMADAKGYEFNLLSSRPQRVNSNGLSYAHWLGTCQRADAQDTNVALADQTWDWLVVDHYALDAKWESAVHQKAKKILVIDDIADRPHDCDALLDQNFYADADTRYVGKVPLHCRVLLGPRYALLRDEFRQLRKQVKAKSGPVKRVLVFFGGMDVDNCTAKAIGGLANIGSEGLHVDVVIGKQHPYRKQIKSACAIHSFDCHVETERMAALMANADLAIGAVGSATWERCSMGLPSVVLVLADNQRKSAVDLDAAGVIVNLGDAHKVTDKELGNKVAELIANDSKRAALSKASLDLVTPLEPNGVVKLMVEKCAN